MPDGGVRLGPFLAASMVAHTVVFIAMGPESLTINTDPTGKARAVSIRLEAAAPAGAAADSAKHPSEVPAESPETESDSRVSPPRPTPKAARVAEIGTPPEPKAQSKRQRALEEVPESATNTGSGNKPNEHVQPAEAQVAEETDSPQAQAHTRSAERDAPVETSAAGTANTSSKAQRAAARDAIVAELARHFRYPRLAQRHGWEGTVVLSVRILPDGRLDDIRITRSSGRALLDRSARRALAGVERLPQFADRIGEGGIALEIPVTYRLESA